MRALLLAAVLLPLAPGAAVARNCADAPTQSEMNACFNNSLRETDAALNTAYRQVTGRLRDAPEPRRQLTEAQRAWISFRDAECRFSTAAVGGGSLRPALEAQCLQGLTAQRLARLREYLSCQEGDMSCPVPPKP